MTEKPILGEDEMTSSRQAAKKMIKVGATYRHRGGGADVVVVDFHEATGRVWWRQARGPGLGDPHRNLDCEDFLSVYQQVLSA